MYNPKQVMQKDNIALIGDAATQVKATTYGGIIYGLISAMYIGERWDDYEKRFRSKLGKDLWVSLKMRNVLNKFSFHRDLNGYFVLLVLCSRQYKIFPEMFETHYS